MYSRSEKSWPYSRSRTSDSAEREHADQDAEHRDREREPQVLGQRVDVTAGEAVERRRQRDQGAHQAERGADADQQAGAREAALAGEVEVGELLGDAGVGAGLADLLDDDAERGTDGRAPGHGVQQGGRLGRPTGVDGLAGRGARSGPAPRTYGGGA